MSLNIARCVTVLALFIALPLGSFVKQPLYHLPVASYYCRLRCVAVGSTLLIDVGILVGEQLHHLLVSSWCPLGCGAVLSTLRSSSSTDWICRGPTLKQACRKYIADRMRPKLRVPRKCRKAAEGVRRHFAIICIYKSDRWLWCMKHVSGMCRSFSMSGKSFACS